jgi:hypothetical protein
MKTVKKAQLQISFGMIFSIILIIFFLAFAGYAIYKFVYISNTGKVGEFVSGLNTDVEDMWKLNKGSQIFSYGLPSGIEQFCINDKSEIYFLPLGSGEGFDYTEIKHLNIGSIVTETDFCVKKKNGEVELLIKKDYGETLVMISAVE